MKKYEAEAEPQDVVAPDDGGQTTAPPNATDPTTGAKPAQRKPNEQLLLWPD